MSYTARNTIFLQGEERRTSYDEARASVAINPGMLIEPASGADAGKVKPHATRGGRTALWIAIEDSLRGLDPRADSRTGTVDDTYAIGDLVRYHRAKRGEAYQMLLHAAESVAVGDYVISYGDGTLCKAASAFLADNVADSTAISNTSTETTFSTGTVTVKKNTLKVGDVIRIRGSVAYPATNSTDTATIKVKFGSTTLIASSAVDVANDDECTFDVAVTIRTIGASGTMVASALITNKTTTINDTLASTAIDTTADKDITVTCTWSAASTGDQAILKTLLVELVKAGTSAGAGSGGGAVVGQIEEGDVDLSVATEPDWCCVRVF